jgi:8-oxo-dGTP pyrophosphatase MutT (NUDIX family)
MTKQNEKVVYSGFIDVIQNTQTRYIKVRSSNRVVAGIIRNVDTNRFLFIKQYRYAANTHTVEIPAGYIEKGERDMESLSREVMEETGYSFDSRTAEYLGSYYSSPGILTEQVSLWYAETSNRMNAGKILGDGDEEIELLGLTYGEALHKVCDLKSKLALMLYKGIKHT